MNRTCPVLSKLADFLRFRPAPANCSEFGFKAVNRRVVPASPTARAPELGLAALRLHALSSEAGASLQSESQAAFMLFINPITIITNINLDFYFSKKAISILPVITKFLIF